MVNRNPEYLKRSALEYVRAHDPQQVSLISASYDKPIAKEKSLTTRKSRSCLRRSSLLTRRSFFQALKDGQEFKWPMDRKSFYLSSLFGYRKRRDGSQKFHYGIDLAALRGTPVYASQDGKVVQAFHDTGYGNTVLLRHLSRYKTRYAHLHQIIVSRGQNVKAGQQIGTVGATGNVRARKGNDPSHLHFELYVDGKHVNPLYFLT